MNLENKSTLTSCHYRIYPGGVPGALANFYLNSQRGSSSVGNYVVTIDVEDSAGRKTQAQVTLKEGKVVPIPEVDSPKKVSGGLLLRKIGEIAVISFHGTLWTDGEKGPFTQVTGLIAALD